jgi:hypothetical protein
MTTDAELVALLVRVDWTGLSLSAKVSWRRDFAGLLREVRVRGGGTPPRRSRPPAPGFEETASVLILGRGGRYRHEQAQLGGEWVTVAGCDGETSWEQDYNPVSGASQISRWGCVRPLGSWPLAPCVRAELHQWADPGAMADSALAGWDAAGVRGAGRLAAAIAAFDKGTYRADQVLAASGGQYKVERIRARRPRGPSAIACDGQRRWKAYPGRLVVGSAAPLRSDVARMIDSAWLLECRLSGAEPVTADGRRGYQVTARPADGRPWRFSGHYVSGQELPAPAVAVVDAESGVLLSLTAFSGERTALHAELRELTFEPHPRDDDFRIAPPPGVTVTEQDDHDYGVDEIF